VLIFTPTYDDLLQDRTAESVEAQEFDGEYDWIVNDDNPYPDRDMRNVCHQFQMGRQMALDGGYDAMLCVEHDMILPPGCLQALWDTPAPVVYAIYMLRHGTRVVNLFQKNGSNNLGMSLSLYPAELRAARAAGVCEVSGAGFGCTLMRREVLERIPFRMSDHPPDLPFSSDCLRAGIKQMGRLDVACGHIDIESGYTLDPWKGFGMIARVLALQTMTVSADGSSLAIKKDRYYSMSTESAIDLMRAGYVRITNEADLEAEQAQREVATAPAAETATARVQKIKPKRVRKPRKKAPAK
jgi:hypothetical protein